jgi:steroid delta-isomerase-like uncharacterized protein
VNTAAATVRSYLDAFWGSRWDELMAYLAENAEYVDPLLPEPVRGREPIRDVLASCHEWGSYEGEIVSLFGDEVHVAAELRIRGSVTAPPAGMSEAVVGKAFEFVECDVFEFDRGGRIARQTIYADGISLQNQLGEPFF